jgi:hypothetical protein
MAGDVCKAEGVKGITYPSLARRLLPPLFPGLPLFLTGTSSLISGLFSRSIPFSLSAPLLASVAHLAPRACPACPFFLQR